MLGTTAQEAVKAIRSGNHIFIHSVAAAPEALIEAMVARAAELRDVQLYHLHTEGEASYSRPEYANSFYTNAFFVGKNVRQAIAEGRGSYIPVFLSEIPRLFRKQIIRLDVALIMVSPPDAHGYCSLGTSVDASLAAVQTARIVIAQVNKCMPRTHGDGLVHSSQIHYAIEHHTPLHQASPEPLSDIERKIGKHVASLVENGATLQMGIGSIPNAVLEALNGHKDLGIHTEMFSDGIIPLAEKGVITGRYKRKHPGKIVSTFLVGSEQLYDFVDDNPSVLLLDVAYVNDTSIIRQNPRATAINSAIEIDITGQVCADSMGYQLYSGVGGQMDFIRGASLSEGGKAIIALPSATSKGISRIVDHLKEGAGVVTTRSHVHYIVTEYGIAYLYGKTLRQRADELIRIAHPEHQAFLEEAAYKRFKS
jgi:4-hydroxybutyrate CoA-transferase